MSAVLLQRVGVVAIGRNEGARLQRCLRSLPSGLARVVYVDSGSTDGSVPFAREASAEVVALDMSTPFTAARARNAGWQRLVALEPGVTFVQFLDGDCELDTGFLPAAMAVLDAEPEVAVVCGRRREVAPADSVFNRLCDMEWNTPVGDAAACGGDALMRVSALRAVGGYDPTLIAGEEPELCLRLRRAGHRIRRIDAEMTRHDAAIERWSQWWLRNARAGHAYAEGFHRYGREPEQLYRREVASNAVWGMGLPALSLGLALPTLGGSLSLLGLYGVLYRRIRADRLSRGDSPEDATLYATYTVLGKVPQARGAVQFYARLLRREQASLIEYK